MPDLALPGWEDVFKITPESSLAPFEQQQLRRDRAIRIQQSPTPEHARNIGRFLTFTDNINDLLNAAVIIGTRWLPIVSRSHPLAAGALTLARYLDLARIVSPFGITGRIGKSRFEEGRLNDPEDNIPLIDPHSTLGRIRSRTLEALVIGQVAEELTGYGISLGPIVGVITDAIFSTPIGEGLEALYSVIDPFTSLALDVVNDAFFGLIEGQTFTPTEHVTFTIGLAVAWGILTPLLARLPDPGLWARSLDFPRRPRPTRKPATLALLAELGHDPRRSPRWPLPGDPETATPIELARALAPRVRGTLQELRTAPMDPLLQELLYGSLRQALRRAYQLTTPGYAPLRESLTPRASLLAALIETPPPDPGGVTAERLARLLELAGPLQEATGRTRPPDAVLAFYLTGPGYGGPRSA